jgi:GNAT superfamily N-acetyltransferase
MKTKNIKISLKGLSVSATISGKQIGSIWVVEDIDSSGNDIAYIKESFLDESFRGQGIGKAMYLAVLENINKIGIRLFKGKNSVSAQRVWDSLEKSYLLRKTNSQSPYQKFEIIKK